MRLRVYGTSGIRLMARWFFFVLGLVWLIIGGLVARRVAEFAGGAVAVKGKVVKVRAVGSDPVEYFPVVSVAAAEPGRSRTITATESCSTCAVGEVVTVLYDPSYPRDARIRGPISLWGTPLFLVSVGLPITLFGLYLLALPVQPVLTARELRTQGRVVRARLRAIERNTSVRRGGTHPWRVVAEWQEPATGAVHVAHSVDLWFDPSPHVPRELNVRVNPEDPSNGLVEVDFLPIAGE